MTYPTHQKFGFDTVFDGGGKVTAQAAPRPKRAFSPEEVEAARAEGMIEGERKALASAAAQQARALQRLADATAQALPTLAAVAHEHREGAAQLAFACAKAMADAALAHFPHAPIQAAMESLAREIEASPRLTVQAPPELAEGLQEVLEHTAQSIGYSGAILVRPNPAYGPAAFTLDFGDGAAAFDPAAAAQRVAQALISALAAEGLHGEPLTPADH